MPLMAFSILRLWPPWTANVHITMMISLCVSCDRDIRMCINLLHCSCERALVNYTMVTEMLSAFVLTCSQSHSPSGLRLCRLR